ncbi:DUF2721 domain-containing protein [Lysobacter sp. TY2-98]|uniref:DUF2721 domain-containing protein n=1 Tax=Lysobacter sp. TY2-98 TaxID=2290922 RepID=UPI000E201A58|nr:DUF2721 domain-containing protein [Lysobacter sp. TY2-98]AXK73562.1 DUF2721 domain-containing protein [Lysobacter sp. TY2-98]
MNPILNDGHYAILTTMLAPALLMTATGSMLVSANARLARVVDRLRGLIVEWNHVAPDPAARDLRIRRHRRRAHLVLRACQMLYLALGCFVGTSLTLAINAFLSYHLDVMPTVLAILGVVFLFGASLLLGSEVSLAVRSFDEELDHEIQHHRS